MGEVIAFPKAKTTSGREVQARVMNEWQARVESQKKLMKTRFYPLEFLEWKLGYRPKDE